MVATLFSESANEKMWIVLKYLMGMLPLNKTEDRNGHNYYYNNFNKKVDILINEKQKKVQWWVINIDNTCHHINTSNPVVGI